MLNKAISSQVKNYQCSYCLKNCGITSEHCFKGSQYMCDNFVPIDENNYSNYISGKLGEYVEISPYKKISRKVAHSNLVAYNSVYSLDEYYVKTMNDILKNIREGGEDYLYDFAKLETIYSMEQNLKVRWHEENCIEVRLRGKK